MEECKKWGVQPESYLELKNWFKNQKHLPQHTPDEYFAMIIHSCYSDVQLSKKTIEAYFRVKTSAPQLFSGRSLDEKAIQTALTVGPISILPSKTEDGYSVIWGWLSEKDASKFIMEDILKFMYMAVDVILLENPGCPGILFVHDSTDFTFKHLFRISITTLRKYFEYIQDGCPIRVKGIHALNSGSAVSYTLSICKPFIYSDCAKMIFVYTAREFETFLKNTKLTIDMVPKEYGGNGPSRDKLLDETVKRVAAHSEWFKHDETLRYINK